MYVEVEEGESEGENLLLELKISILVKHSVDTFAFDQSFEILSRGKHGILESWNPGIPESRNPGILESRNPGILESWNPGIL